MSIKKEVIAEIVNCLEWYVENDDTNNFPSNEFWLDGLERARRALQEYHEEEIAEKLK